MHFFVVVVILVVARVRRAKFVMQLEDRRNLEIGTKKTATEQFRMRKTPQQEKYIAR